MSFDERFELGPLLRDDGIQTFAAKAKAGAEAGGPDLLAHFLANPAEAPDLSASLHRLPERERQRIVDQGERAGIVYVVTGSLAGYSGFREWLAQNGRAAKPLDAAGAWKVILPEGSVDEQFLALFPTQEGAQPTPPKPPPPPAATVPGAPSAEPGEFTRMFQAQPPRSAPPVTPPNLPPPPGEFTRMFQAPNPPSPPATGGAKPAGAPGEFTRFFEAQLHEDKATLAGFPPTPPQPAAGTPKQGEFTKVFGRGEIRSEPPSPMPVSPAPAPAAPPPARLFEALPGPARSPGPGDYTRRFSAAPALSLGQASETAAGSETAAAGSVSSDRGSPQAASAMRGSRWPLILGIAAIAVLLAAVILFVVTRVK